MVDPDIIINGVLAGLTADRLSDNSHHTTTHHHLSNITHLLRLLTDYYETHILPLEASDVTGIQNVYKDTFGSPWIPTTHGRQYLRVLAGTPVVLSVSSILGVYTLTIPAGTWTPLDLPDQTVVRLDGTASANQLSLYYRATNQHP